MGKNKRREKNRARLCIVYIFIYLYLHPSLCLLQWMHGNIYREVFPTFLAKKSYDWWITRRRMEIYTKISKRKDLKWSWRNRGKFAPRMGCANLEGVVRVLHKLKVLCEFRTSLEHLSSKAISSSFQLQIVHGLKCWILDFLSFEMVYRMQKMDFGKCSKSAKEDCRCCPLFSSLCLFFLFASLLCLACLNDPKSCQNTKNSHKYDQKSLLSP